MIIRIREYYLYYNNKLIFITSVRVEHTLQQEEKEKMFGGKTNDL
jgi:hypothetical protein